MEFHKKRDKIYLYEGKFYSYKRTGDTPNPIIVYQYDQEEIAETIN